MVLKFVLEILIFICLGIAVYFLARALPRIGDDRMRRPAGGGFSWLMPYLEKTDSLLKVYSEIFLRRLKVFILRLDNWVSQRLADFRKDGKESAGLPLDNLSGSGKDKED